MPTGKPKCPVCQGKGTITEDSEVYEFITRDPITSKCMICKGEGWLNPSTRLPNGKRAFEVFRKGDQGTGNMEQGKRLNVSKKAAINPTGLDLGLRKPADGSENRLKPVERPAKASGTIAKASGTNKFVVPVLPTPGLPKQGEGKEPYEAPKFLEMALNPRLNKVLASGKMFLIVTETEPYYLDVYRMIRKQEKKQGSWTADDEERYVETLEGFINDYKMKEAWNG